MVASWPFEDPSNLAVFTTRPILCGGRPILLVTHDADDGAWQFHDGSPFCPDDAMVVALAEVATRDPTVYDLADLPLGWAAWRDGPQEPWQRAPSRIVDDDEDGICPGCGFRHLPDGPDPEPNLDGDGWSLESGAALRHQLPDTFWIPSECERAGLVPGDIAKLIFRLRTRDGGTLCERMWVRVSEAGTTGYLGVLDNDPATHGVLQAGDLIPFRAEHVIDIARDPGCGCSP